MPLELADVITPPEGPEQDYLWTLNCGAAALDLGGFTAFLYAFNQREKIYDISETASGQRFHPSFTRVGGLMGDVTDDWITQVRAFIKEFPKAHADVVRLLNRNRI